MKSTIFDSHCHPQFSQYEKDREEVLGRAREAGIRLICVGTDYETSKQGIELAQKHDNVWATVGLHPNDNLNEKFNAKEYEELFKMPKVVAIGEIGLDYYRTPDLKDQDLQKKRFEEQLGLAVKMNMPLILHARDSSKGSTGKAHSDIFGIFGNWKLKIGNSAFRGVAHSFTGNIEDAKKYLDLDFYLGFNGILTFARQYDEMIRYIPLEKILLETDAPYLTPEPYRGQRNEPVYVVEVAKKIAELKNKSFEKVIEQTTKSCQQLFNLQ